MADGKLYLPAKWLQEPRRTRQTASQVLAGSLAMLIFSWPILAYFLIQSRLENDQWYNLSGQSTPCGSPTWSIPSGFQGLLTVDVAYGDMAFSLAKFVDIVWDILIGRGGQLLIAWIDYRVFSDALMRIMETTTVPYDLYIEITFSPPSVATLAPIFQVMKRKMFWYHRLLFLWLLLSVLWITSYGTVVSAMTGYAANNYAMIRLLDGSYVNATIFQAAEEAYTDDYSDPSFLITRNTSSVTLYGKVHQITNLSLIVSSYSSRHHIDFGTTYSHRER